MLKEQVLAAKGGYFKGVIVSPPPRCLVVAEPQGHKQLPACGPPPARPRWHLGGFEEGVLQGSGSAGRRGGTHHALTSCGDEEGGDGAAFFMDETAEKGLSLLLCALVSTQEHERKKKKQSKSAL